MKEVELQVQIQGVYQVVDIDKNTSFSLNYDASDLQNPTTVQNTYSSAITIPKTKNNNDLFGNIWQINSIIGKFNPTKRANFRLYINFNIFEEGYIKMEEIKEHEYTIRLFGNLGNFFRTLSDIKLQALAVNANHTVNVKGFQDYLVFNNGIFSYALTYQGQYDKFDNNSTQNDEDIEQSTWTGTTQYTNVELDENKRQEKEYAGEYRTYYQKPTLRLRRIIEAIINVATDNGFTVDLDPEFFSDDNPYYNETWILCNNYTPGDIPGGYNLNVSTFGDTNASEPQTLKIKENQATTWTSSGDAPIPASSFVSPDATTQINTSTLLSEPISLKAGDKITVNLKLRIYATSYDTSQNYRRKIQQLNTYLDIIDNNTGNVLNSRSRPTTSGYNEIVDARIFGTNNLDEKRPTNEDGFGYKQNFIYDRPLGNGGRTQDGETEWRYSLFYINNSTIDQEVRVVFRVDGYTNWSLTNDISSSRKYGVAFEVKSGSIVVQNQVSNPSGGRTGAYKTFADMIGSEHSCFDFLISYGKIFGLFFKVKRDTGNVWIGLRKNYFDAENPIDWTYKVDRSRDFIIEPTALKFRRGVFKYNALGTKYEELHKNNEAESGSEISIKNGNDYGSFTVDTNYGFGDTEYNYLEGIIFDNIIIASDYSRYYQGRSPILFKDEKELPHLQNLDESKVNLSGFGLLFRDNTSPLNIPLRISDDTAIMNSYGTICWNNSEDNYIRYKLYPKYVRTIQRDDQIYSLNFGHPGRVYSDSDALMNANSGIYPRFWRAYINDRLDDNSKILTCYVKLTPSDIQYDLLSKFIYLDNAIWVIEKIIGFNPVSENVTKVELIKVKDPNNYIELSGNYMFRIYDRTHSEWIFDHASGNPPQTIVIDSETTLINLEVFTDITWTASSGLTISPTSGQPDVVFMEVNVPLSINNGFITFYYGTSSVTINIVRYTFVNVTASTSPTASGTVTINGQSSPQQIAIGSTATFSATGATDFLYWDINGEIYETSIVTITITEATNGVAYFLASNQIRLYCDDEYTTITGVDKINNYWVLEVGQSYEFNNPQNNFSGFLFSGDEEYTTTGSRTILATDTYLNVYYDRVLINATIINNSPLYNFSGEKIYLGSSSLEFEVLQSDTQTLIITGDPGEITFDRLDYHYPTFSQTSFPAPGIYDLTITGNRVGWDGDKSETIYDGSTSITRTVYAPINFILLSNLGISTNSGSSDTNVTITFTEDVGEVVQRIGGFDYTLSLLKINI